MSEPWHEGFRAALRAPDLAAALAILAQHNTGHAGTPTTQVKQTALDCIAEMYPELGPRADLAMQLADESVSEPVAAELSVALILECVDGGAMGPDEAAGVLKRLADHSNWEVREAVAGSLGTLLAGHWQAIYPCCQEWSGDVSVNVRRAVILAAKYAGKQRWPSWGEPLLDLLEPLLADRSRYVRVNLGPFAIGDGMLRYYPDETLARLRRWGLADDEATRWNVAMTFSAAEAAKHISVGLEVLGRLAEDPRPFVSRAVAAGLRNLGRRRPEVVLPVIEQWRGGSRRSAVERALSFIQRQA